MKPNPRPSRGPRELQRDYRLFLGQMSMGSRRLRQALDQNDFEGIERETTYLDGAVTEYHHTLSSVPKKQRRKLRQRSVLTRETAEAVLAEGRIFLSDCRAVILHSLAAVDSALSPTLG